MKTKVKDDHRPILCIEGKLLCIQGGALCEIPLPPDLRNITCFGLAPGGMRCWFTFDRDEQLRAKAGFPSPRAATLEEMDEIKERFPEFYARLAQLGQETGENE
jgi:hypothetical protein